MIYGHLPETNKNRINGNREINLFNDAIRSLKPWDILDLMCFYDIPYTVKHSIDEIYDNEWVTVESETLLFVWCNDEMVTCARKVNILEELQEKYNLPY